MKGTNTINLQNYRNQKSKIFSGRTFGQDVRKQLKLDHFDKTEEIITIKIPDDTWSINSSYFLGVFGQSVRFLGEERFREKYNFTYKNEYIRDNIEQGIRDALDEV